MPIYERCDPSVFDLAQTLRAQYPEHEALDVAKVRIDYVFARSKRDEDNNKLDDAITHHGTKCLGLASIRNLKARTLMEFDAEILLDADHWDVCGEPQRRALLDHELFHFGVTDKIDDLRRPVLRMRKHDVEFGWFATVAARHGSQSIERIQAKAIVDQFGQYFLLGFADPIEIHEPTGGAAQRFVRNMENMTEGASVTISGGDGEPVTIHGKRKAAAKG